VTVTSHFPSMLRRSNLLSIYTTGTPVVSDGRHGTLLFLISQLLLVTIKLSLHLIKHHTTKTHEPLVSAPDVGERSASRLYCSTSGEIIR
jgi:hypothetical protein